MKRADLWSGVWRRAQNQKMAFNSSAKICRRAERRLPFTSDHQVSSYLSSGLNV